MSLCNTSPHHRSINNTFLVQKLDHKKKRKHTHASPERTQDTYSKKKNHRPRANLKQAEREWTYSSKLRRQVFTVQIRSRNIITIDT